MWELVRCVGEESLGGVRVLGHVERMGQVRMIKTIYGARKEVKGSGAGQTRDREIEGLFSHASRRKRCTRKVSQRVRQMDVTYAVFIVFILSWPDIVKHEPPLCM